MNAKIRFLSIVLSLMLMFTAILSSCDTAEDKSGTDTETVAGEATEVESKNSAEEVSVSDTESETVLETEARYIPEIPQKDYGDYLYMLAYGGDSYIKFLWVEESDSSLLSQAVYERQVDLMNHLGVELICSKTQGWAGYYEPFQTSVKNKDGAIDVFFPNYYLGIAEMISGGYVTNLDNIDLFDFDVDYWDYDFMDSLALEGNHYLGYNDFNVMKAHVVTFNKEMLAKYEDALDETLYESVYNYHWTIDKMISVANLVYIDATGDGKTADDSFGISAQQWQPFVPFLMSSNIKLVDEDESGKLGVSVMSNLNSYKTIALVDKLKALAESNCSWFKWQDDKNVSVIELQTNRALMNLSFTSDLDKFLNYEVTFGILPYPMFDENQKDVGYLSLNKDTYIMLPSYMRNEQMITESIELLAYYSSDVRTAVFDKWLGKQAADEPDDVRMLNLVWDNLYSDFGVTYSTISASLDSNLYMLPTLTKAMSDKSVASHVASYTKSANNAITKYMATIRKMNNN